MKDVVTTSAVFFNYALLAVFAQNAVFTRALGVSRLVQLVGDDRTSSWLFGMQLCITQIRGVRGGLLLCKRSGQLLRILPTAAINSCVLGTVLVERTQSFTLGQSLGFGLGSGLGYVLAVLLVTEARHRLRSKAIPEAFRGLPITLVYIGVLALAIYGFTGHSVIL